MLPVALGGVRSGNQSRYGESLPVTTSRAAKLSLSPKTDYNSEKPTARAAAGGGIRDLRTWKTPHPLKKTR